MTKLNQLEMPLVSREEDASSKRSLLDQMMLDSSLYQSGNDYKQLLEFVGRLRNFAPFNAMLLNIQKPGLLYAATKEDWSSRFDRHVKEDAHPLLILWPFAPVIFVYDVEDTEGKDLPKAFKPFRAVGNISNDFLSACFDRLKAKNIRIVLTNEGIGSAGSIGNPPIFHTSL